MPPLYLTQDDEFSYQDQCEGICDEPSLIALEINKENTPKKDAIKYPTYDIGGYIQGDWINFFGNTAGLNSGGNIPSARVKASGNFNEDWSYDTSFEFADSTLQNANMSYEGFNPFYIKMGQFSTTLGLSSSPDTPQNNTFLMVALPVLAFAPNNGIGAQIGTHTDFFTFTGDVFYPGLGTTVVGSDPISTTARITFSPVHTDTRVYHIEISDLLQYIDGSKTLIISSKPEVQPRNVTDLVNTGTMNDVSSMDSANLSAVAVLGPFLVQAEFFQTWVNRNNGMSNLNFSGEYLTTSYFLTGESRKYDFEGGQFVGITPIHHPRIGAWQIAARVSRLNLTNRDITGGVENNYTLGLNWYANNYIRAMLDAIHVVANPNGTGVNQVANVIALRMQAAIQ